MFQSLLELEGSLQSSKQIFKQEKMPQWQTGCLSIIHPCLGATQHQDQARGQLSMFTRSIGILQNERLAEKDNSRDSKMKLACHAEQGTQ